MANREKRAMKVATRSRRRGGERRTAVPMQRLADRVEDQAVRAREAGELAVSGDRPMVVGLVLLIVLAVVTLSAPLQSYLDQSSRVDGLSQKVTVLSAGNEQLAAQVQDLTNPLTIELIAREQQGFVRPGEEAYTVVPPEVARPQIAVDAGGLLVDERPWYQRAWEWAGDLVG